MKLTKVRQELDLIKSEVIGIYKHRTLGVFELVTKLEGDTINTIFISQFGAIQQGFGIQHQQGTLILFPENKNMNQMLENPFEWDKFIKQFNCG
jgi:hypothetical protein